MEDDALTQPTAADMDALREIFNDMERRNPAGAVIIALLDRLERLEKKDGLRTREHNVLVQENRDLRDRLAQMTAALRETRGEAH
jgi:hypothetical protein